MKIMKKSFILKLFCVVYTFSLLFPGTAPAQRAGQVILYEHYNFKGNHGSFYYQEGGSNKTSDLKIGDDNLSSLKVGKGIKVILYFHNNSGPSIEFYEGTYPELTCGWDNEITSMEIKKVHPKERVVMFYMHGKDRPYQRQGLGFGDWDFRTGGASPEIMCDNTISRLVVPDGVTVELWEHTDFEGQHVEYGKGDHDLQRTTFDNMTSSIRVIPRLFALGEIEFYGEKIIQAKPEDMLSATITLDNSTNETQSGSNQISKTFVSNWEKTESSTVGGEISVTTTVTAKGGIETLGVSAGVEVSIATSIAASYSESVSKSKGESEGVKVTCNSNLTVPKGAKYSAKMIVTPVIKEYKIRHVYYQVDTSGEKIPGGEEIVVEDAGKIRMKYASDLCDLKMEVVSTGTK